jgi:hypothetical protein
VAGVFLAIVYWRDYFDGLPPLGADGIIVVLDNDCGQQYTYQVDGSSARFVAFGDLHDTRYDYLGTGTKLDSIIAEDADEMTTGNEGTPPPPTGWRGSGIAGLSI